MAIEQINNGVQQVSQVVSTNAATSEESAAASEELSGQAAQLKETISLFKLKRDKKEIGKINTEGKRLASGAAPASAKSVSVTSGDMGKY